MSHMDRRVDARPGTASVRVTDVGWQGLLNPNPLNREQDDGLVDEYLSPGKLQALTGVENLQDAKALQMCVDTSDSSLGNFGNYMPSLRQLKLNNSLILSVRDLGTSLSHLQVLWMARCGLTDLDGISSFCSLKELYLAYNDLSDLSQVSMLEHLEILDLEGNNLEHVCQLQYLALCSNLTTLTLEGNPICARPSPEAAESPDYNYRSEVWSLIPHLRFLDDSPTDQLRPHSSYTPTQDWLLVRDYIKDSVVEQEDTGPGSDPRKQSLRPTTAHPALIGRPRSAPRPASAGRPAPSHQGAGGSPLTESINSEEGEPGDEASDLTHGVSRVICGNPIKALRARKEKLGLAPVIPHQHLGHRSQHTYDSEDALDKDRNDVFAELRAWRDKHDELLQRIQKDRAPQVLTIRHSDEEERRSSSYSSEDEELRDPSDSGCLVRVSPEPFSPCPVPQLPAISGSRNPRSQKAAEIRAKRLLRGANQRETTATGPATTGAYLGGESFALMDIDRDSTRTLRGHGAGSSELGERPVSGPARIGPIESRSPVDRNSPKLISSHRPVIRSSTKSVERPHLLHVTQPITASGVLQRLPSRPTLLMGNKTPNT
ncbi:leucine-rich repeat-containing protein 56 isoform X2 [Ascaphus truei]|uniref:leucine-rich repeat-containing protein 56 isoform X2 n=1 Tax=Ascaphus truei TaxID=8439 RepID=UPI003F592346